MADNSIQIDLELTTKSFETAIAQATKAAENFSKGLSKSTDEASKGLDAAGKAGKDAGDKIAKGGESASTAWETFKGVLGAEAFVGAFDIMKEAAKGLFDTFVVEGVKGAEEAEASLTKLKSALLVSGDSANGTLEDFQKFSEQVKKSTIIDDDAVIAQLALAKQYGLTNDQAKQVVLTAVDMASRGYELDTSVKQLSESFSGQAGKLAKLNPVIRDLTAEQLKAGAAADLLGAQFAGSAAAKVETFQGAIDQTKNAFADLQKAIGFIIIQNPALITVIKQANELFTEATQYIGDNSEAIKALITEGVTLLVEGLREAVSAGLAFTQFLTDNQEAIKAAGVALGAMAVGFGAFIVATEGAAVALGVAAAAQGVLNFVLTANPIGVVIVALGLLAGAVYYVAQNFDEITVAVIGFTATALQTLLPTITNVLAAVAALASVFSDDLAQSIADSTATIQDSINALSDLEASGQDALDQKRAKARADKKAADDAALAARLQAQVDADAAAGNQATSTAATELAALQAKLREEAQAQKDATKAAEDAEKLRLENIKKAEAKFDAELNAQRKEAARNFLKTEADYLAEKDRKDDEDYRDRLQAEKGFFDSLRDEKRDQIQFEKATDKDRVANAKSTLGAIAGLMDSSNGALFEAGKTAAIAQATISTYEAVVNALAQVPYPFNIAAAAAVGVAGALQITKIASTPRPAKTAGNFAEGGIVPGSSFSGDRLTANVNSGEGIFTMAQQKRLFNIANGQDGDSKTDSGGRLDALTNALLSQPIVLQLDGETVATAVRTQVRGGFDLGVA